MIKKLDIKSMNVAEKVLKLQKYSYQIEADIIDFYDIPPLKETLETLMKCNEEFWGYIVNDEIAGIISYKISESVLDIHRLAIHPNFFKRGIGKKLLDFVESVDSLSEIVVCTGKKNKPAINLYRQKGYKFVADIKIEDNLILTKFVKNLN